MSIKLYLSHASDAEAFVDKLTESLTSRGIETYSACIETPSDGFAVPPAPHSPNDSHYLGIVVSSNLDVNILTTIFGTCVSS
jgi:hypothetical protein